MASIGAAAGCQPAAPPNSNSTNGAVVNSTTANSSNGAVNTGVTTPETGTTTMSSSSTPTDAYKAAYKYRQNKDVEGLKKVFSKDVLEFLTMVGKEEKKTLDDQLRELTEQPQFKSDEARNEKITGDRATIEYRDTDGAWKTMDFVKEDGAWKMSLPGGDGDEPKKDGKKP
jgi:hypothetical protein